MRKITVRLPEDLARALKMKAAAEDETVAGIITRLVERELKGGEKKK
jgi:predicted DNA binding CopG/RHH family protein